MEKEKGAEKEAKARRAKARGRAPGPGQEKAKEIGGDKRRVREEWSVEGTNEEAGLFVPAACRSRSAASQRS